MFGFATDLHDQLIVTAFEPVVGPKTDDTFRTDARTVAHVSAHVPSSNSLRAKPQ